MSEHHHVVPTRNGKSRLMQFVTIRVDGSRGVAVISAPHVTKSLQNRLDCKHAHPFAERIEQRGVLSIGTNKQATDLVTSVLPNDRRLNAIDATVVQGAANMEAA